MIKCYNRKDKALIKAFAFLSFSLALAQSPDQFKRFKLPHSKLFNESLNQNSNYSFGFSNNIIFNNGHPNIDNYSEIFSPAKFSEFYSAFFYFSNRILTLRLEPYVVNHNNIFNTNLSGTYAYNNNHYKAQDYNKIKESGLKQSYIMLKIKSIGFSYGNISHWWGPGIHSAIALSSNASSQKTYSIGTYDEIDIGNFSIKSKLIAMPYRNIFNENIFFSGLKSSISHNSKNSKITIGFHRTYLSGDFTINNLRNPKKWTIEDAAKLVLEPLFGQDKSSLGYTIIGTPGFDKWDEVLTGYVKIKLHEEDLEIYLDVASDDNRSNLIDLKAHWDHTLGYQLGINKRISFNKSLIFLASEYTTTRTSNTFNGKFYRGNENSPNFYTKTLYDYFSYEGRRMGAHSGTSSEDLYFLLGYEKSKSSCFISLNLEKHGLKNMLYPEIKSELTLSLQRKFLKNIHITTYFEYETISNYGFISNKKSISRPFWISFSYIM
tara:strand:- start:2611 stop:4083 length:1473 start_codon:yes stop_codon:yes gene_type:complete